MLPQFSPPGGPINGGTTLYINGTNLGKTVNDIKTGVEVAGVQCTVIDAEYVPPERIVCKTGPASRATDGPITVRVDNSYTAKSTDDYRYADPILKDFDPKDGPMSGGTNVTIFGQNLDLGSNFMVKMDKVRMAVLE